MLTTKVLRTIQRYGMVGTRERVLIGLSGGPDSVVLTDTLVELASALGIELVLAHLNHGARAEADEDEAFCRDLADTLRLPYVAGRADVVAGARAAKRSIEDEARRARYTFLFDQAAHHGCARVAVGHTMDDQAETFLMRLARGSGIRGLSSVYPVVKKENTSLIRPLIEARRSEILAHIEARGLTYREDASNLDRDFTRNRLRHDVLPYLAETLNPRLTETLARSAAILRDEEDYMESQAREAFAELTAAPDAPDADVRVSVSALETMHPALRRRLVRLAVEQVNGDTANLTSSHVADVLKLLERGRSGREIHLPGLVASRSFDELTFTAGSGREPVGYVYNGFDYRLTIPAQLPVRECRGLLTAHLAEPAQTGDEPGAAAGNAVVVGVEDGVSELRVRSPKPTDRFRPLGAPGSKPLARYLMERKVAKEDRCHVPLVVRDNKDEILWVAGHAVSETARLEAGRRRLHLEWMNL